MNLSPGRYLLTLLLLPALVSAAPTLQQANLTVVDDHLVPRYQTLMQASDALHQETRRFCTAPDAAGLEVIQQDFRDTMDAWMGIQHIRFGPAELFLRHHRFQYWPDKHNTGSKQLRKLLASEDMAVLSEDRFRETSVAVQGLSTLERLLFTDKPVNELFGSTDAPSYRCLLVEAISANLAMMASGMVTDWTRGDAPYREVIADAEQGNDYYETSKEVTARLLNNFHTQLQVIVDQKLLRPLSTTAEKAKPRRAEAWRSHRSLDNIITNLEALQELYLTGFAPMLQDPQQRELDQQIRNGFKEALAAARAIDQPLYTIAADAQHRPQLQQLIDSNRQLKRIVGTQLPGALGLTLGFNSLDGD